MAGRHANDQPADSGGNGGRGWFRTGQGPNGNETEGGSSGRHRATRAERREANFQGRVVNPLFRNDAQSPNQRGGSGGLGFTAKGGAEGGDPSPGANPFFKPKPEGPVDGFGRPIKNSGGGKPKFGEAGRLNLGFKQPTRGNSGNSGNAKFGEAGKIHLGFDKPDKGSKK